MDDAIPTADSSDETVSPRLERWLLRVRTISRRPDQIARDLSEHVIGQDEAVRAAAVLVRQHVKRLQEAIHDDIWSLDYPMRRETRPVLLVGPSGCGKTLLASHVARMAALPYVVEDCTSQTATGFVGRSVSDILAGLIVRSDGGIFIARWGLVVLDEVDKLRRRTASGSLDIGGEGAQRSLLALLDGGVIQVEWPPLGPREARTWRPFGCERLMILMAGAFSGLDDIVRRRLGMTRRKIGFAGPATKTDDVETFDILSQALPEDLIAHGMMPELVGRIGEIVPLRPLGREDLRRILIEAPDGPLALLQEAARRERFEFVLHDDLVDAIVEEASSRGLGARGLHSILSRITRRAMFEIPSDVSRFSEKRNRAELGVDAVRDGSYELVAPRGRKPRTRKKAEA